jgi:hypothetical protein
MGDAPGELPDDLHLLRLAKRFLGLHPLLDFGRHPLLEGIVEPPQVVLRGTASVYILHDQNYVLRPPIRAVEQRHAIGDPGK